MRAQAANPITARRMKRVMAESRRERTWSAGGIIVKPRASGPITLLFQQFAVLAQTQHRAQNAEPKTETAKHRARIPESVQADCPQAGDAKALGVQRPFEATAVLPERGGDDPRPEAVPEWR